MNTLVRLFNQARAELKANPRLRLGVWVIVALLLFGWVFVVQPDRAAAAYSAYARAADQLTASHAVLAHREAWPGLLASARDNGEALQARFWRAETEGLAKAGLQETLERMVADLDMRNVVIDSGASRAMPGMDSVWQVQARLDATFTPGAELKLLHALATHQRKLVIERLDLRRARQSRIQIIVSAYFLDLQGDAEPPE